MIAGYFYFFLVSDGLGIGFGFSVDCFVVTLGLVTAAGLGFSNQLCLRLAVRLDIGFDVGFGVVGEFLLLM